MWVPKLFPFCLQRITAQLTGTLWKFRSGDGGSKGYGCLLKWQDLCGHLAVAGEDWSTLWKGAEQSQDEQCPGPRGHTSTLGGKVCVGRGTVVMAITVRGCPTETGKPCENKVTQRMGKLKSKGGSGDQLEFLTWCGISYKKLNEWYSKAFSFMLFFFEGRSSSKTILLNLSVVP